MRTLKSCLPVLLIFCGFTVNAWAQQTPLNAADCASGALMVEHMVKLRRAGVTREQLKAIMSATTPDKDKARLINQMVDSVYDDSPTTMDTLANRFKVACAAPPLPAKAVPTATVDASLKRLRLVEDKMTGTRWYFHPTSPKVSNSNGFYLYFGTTDGTTFTPIHLVSRYYGGDWIFVKDAWAKADGKRIAIPQDSAISATQWQRDNGGGAIWEEFDSQLVKPDDIAATRKLAESREVTIRFEGSRYVDDRKLTLQQLSAMREVIQAYEAITGKAWK